MRPIVLRVVLVAAMSVLLVPAARAEVAFGIEVYPGARRDELSDSRCRRLDPSLKSVRCFRTSDEFAKVLAFYAKQAQLVNTALYESMPQSMREDLVNGKKRSMEWCRKGNDKRCNEMFQPSVRIVSPWSDNLNLSPATPPDQYPAQDVLIFIRSND